jgi:hypothetical protein
MKYTHSRRDDLEGLGYTIIHLMTDGNNPWEQIPNNEVQVSTASHNEFIRVKKEFIEREEVPP